MISADGDLESVEASRQPKNVEPYTPGRQRGLRLAVRVRVLVSLEPQEGESHDGDEQPELERAAIAFLKRGGDQSDAARAHQQDGVEQ
jgi:hypothetical protein